MVAVGDIWICMVGDCVAVKLGVVPWSGIPVWVDTKSGLAENSAVWVDVTVVG